MSRIRWIILLLGPVPIIGASWAISGWFQSGPPPALAQNEIARGFQDVLWESHRPLSAAEADAGDAGFAQTCDETARRLDGQLGPECRVLTRSPFVLGGDLSQEELATWHADTIVPAARSMQASYFVARPDQPVTILLFRSEHSYNRYSEKLFGETGISQYGYYKPNSRTLLLNISTGAGTLLHELTHALMDFDFPAAPDWLNEGLASLHEQCRFRESDDGPWIEGLVNWRLEGLQETVRRGKLQSLAALIEERGFRGAHEGIHYAQARYFCLYVQQRGRLAEFYRALRANHTNDPRGLATLSQMFRPWTWQELDRDFQRGAHSG